MYLARLKLALHNMMYTTTPKLLQRHSYAAYLWTGTQVVLSYKQKTLA